MKKNINFLSIAIYMFVLIILLFGYYVFLGLHEMVPINPIDVIYVLVVLSLGEYVRIKLKI